MLHPIVARHYFPRIVENLQAAQTHHEDEWRLVYAAYPHIGIHVLDAEKRPSVGVLIDASDWPHRPLGFLPTDLSFTEQAPYDALPKVPDPMGRPHLVSRSFDGRPWFCVIGTREYHDHYHRILPWESIRHLPQNEPATILGECLSTLDRAQLRPIGALPLWARTHAATGGRP